MLGALLAAVLAATPISTFPAPKTTAPNVALPQSWTYNNVLKASEANAIASRVLGWISVAEPPYNAKCDGVTDDTAAFAAALAAISAQGGGTLYIPVGTCLVTPGRNNIALALQIPANTHIRGDGQNSVIKLNTPAMGNTTGANGTWVQFALSGNNIMLTNFALDGNQASLSNVPTSIQMFGFARGITGNVSGLVVQDVWAHDLPGVANESFWWTLHLPGVTTNAQAGGNYSNIVFRKIEAWNNSGSPISIDGFIDDANLGNVLGGYLTDNVLVDGVYSHDNTWQGITVYGGKNVRIRNSHFKGNHVRGINMEWADNVDLRGNFCDGNYRAGIGTDGLVNFVAEGNKLVGNNTQGTGTPSTTDGEFTIYGGQWYLGSPKPTGNLGTGIIRNNDVTPLAGGRHIWYAQTTTINGIAPNVGNSLPVSIVVDQPDIDQWLLGQGSSPPQQAACITHQGGPSSLHTVGIGQLISLGQSGIVPTAYASSGNNNPGAVTLTTSTQNNNVFTQGIFRPNRTYRVRVRSRQEDANGTWIIAIREADGGSNQFTAATFLADSSLNGTWRQTDFVFTLNSAWQVSRLQFVRSDAGGGSSSLSVDYVNIEELASSQSLSEAPTWAGRVVGRGTSAPTTGTWRRGDLWMNDTPTNLGDMAWVCTTAGTPGTWTQLGTNPVFGLSGAAGSSVTIEAAAANNRDLIWNTGTQPRWIARVTNTAEGGSNAGSDFSLLARADGGGALSTVLSCTRSNSFCTFAGGGSFAGSLAIGGGTSIASSYGGTYNINFGALTVDDCITSSQTLTGVATGGVCSVSTDGNIHPATTDCYVSGANTVVIRACTPAAVTLGAGNFRVRVWQP